jgi:copper chaperone CopZ
MNPSRTLLPLADAAACSCCSSDTAGTATTNHVNTHAKETAMSTQTFGVTGMTCAHCVSAVTDELKQIPGVSHVSVDLVTGGTSLVTVTSESPVGDPQVAAALDEAGDYVLAGS